MEEGKLPLLCIGIDIGKKKHVAGFVSQRSQKIAERPLAFDNSRDGFGQLLSAMGKYASPGGNLTLWLKS